MDTIVAVDVTPRWIYGHTCLDETCTDHGSHISGSNAMALIHQRLNILMTAGSPGFGELSNVRTVVAVELESLHRYRLLGLKGDRLLLCGVYGDECVFTAARQLRRRGYPVALLEDACLWSAPLAVLLEDEHTARELNTVSRWRALDLWPNLVELADAAELSGLWDGEPPSL